MRPWGCWRMVLGIWIFMSKVIRKDDANGNGSGVYKDEKMHKAMTFTTRTSHDDACGQHLRD